MENNYTSHLHSLEKKLYQLIISRLDGDKITSREYQGNIIELIKKGVGGFILFGGEKDEIRDFINKIQSISEIPLFIASDIERGVGQQIRGTSLFPCQMAMAAAINRNNPEDISKLRSALRAVVDEANDVGINMPLIPVLDVNQNPDNPIICTRAFSDNPDNVSWFGSEYIKILDESGLISCAKHFPGHGDTAVDSHISLPVITKLQRELMSVDIMPFVGAIKAGVSSIMIGHLSVPSVDSKPASLSKKIITDLLRKDLGFDGLILSDALNMDALKGIENIPAECINAGIDILLHPADADITAKELLSALGDNKISEEQIDAAAGRIVKIKARIQNIKKAEVDYNQHVKLSEHITEMSITLVKHKEGLLPIQDVSRINLVFAGDKKLYELSPLKNYFKNYTEITNTNNILYDKAIFAIFTSVTAWKGSSGIDDKEKHHIIELIKKVKNSIVISFGNPYILRHFKEADILIAAYEGTEQVQKAVTGYLMGEKDFNGKLPVMLNIKS